MSILERFKPKFWDHRAVHSDAYREMFDFRLLWKQAVLVTALFAVIPLIVLTFVDYRLTRSVMESEFQYRTLRFVSNTKRTLAFFLHERRFAIDFIIHDNEFEQLRDPLRLAAILNNLKKGLSGVSDMGLIDPTGRQVAYAGEHLIEGVDYSGQPWFAEAVEKGMYISEVFLGYRNQPHLVIAVKHELPDGAFFILRASVDMIRIKELLSQLEISPLGDTFIVNRDGVLQTPSRIFGEALSRMDMPVPEYSDKSRLFETVDHLGNPILVGYAYIPETPFVFMVVKPLTELMKPIRVTTMKLIAFLIGSIAVIMFVVLGMSTFLVSKIYQADERRLMALHEVEYSNKMASIGRLAAGVAHEINNPLAIINEKAGLMQDLLTMKSVKADDSKLLSLVDSIVQSVQRCSSITRRLLGFARQSETAVQQVNLENVIQEVLGFLNKEAAYRSITIFFDFDRKVPDFKTDKGKLQQVLLNLINNAFSALAEGGRLDIQTELKGGDRVSIRVTDNGCGIRSEDLPKIFEPFFTTKTKQGGTGLGLSITYGLVQELGGKISVASEPGVGTSFEILLPLNRKK